MSSVGAASRSITATVARLRIDLAVDRGERAGDDAAARSARSPPKVERASSSNAGSAVTTTTWVWPASLLVRPIFIAFTRFSCCMRPVAAAARHLTGAAGAENGGGVTEFKVEAAACSAA